MGLDLPHEPEGSEVRFPRIPIWKGEIHSQVISPLDDEGLPNNSLDKITRLFPRAKKGNHKIEIEPSREVVWLGGIMHRGPHAMLDFSNTFNQKYDATFTYFDNPKATYDLDHIADQVVDYLRQLIERDPAKEFVICGASAGEMLARRVYEKLNTEQNKLIISRIKHHFSVCGVSTYDELSGPQRKLISSLESRIGKAVATGVAKLVQMRYFDILSGSLIRDNIFARMSEENSAKLRNAWKVKHPEFVQDPDQVDIGKHQVRLHQNRGRNSVKTESHFDIFHTIYEQRIITGGYTTPPSTILYSPNDPTYSKPQRNAEVNSTFYQGSRVREIHEGGHVDVVFQSEKYLEPIEEILDEIWNNEGSQRE